MKKLQADSQKIAHQDKRRPIEGMGKWCPGRRGESAPVAVTGIDHVVVNAADPMVLVDWYVDLLGQALCCAAADGPGTAGGFWYRLEA